MNRDQVVGMFLGVAIGDALGMPVETMTAEEISAKHGRITSYLKPTGHKWYGDWKAGRWTDDTQLTLALAESMIAMGKIDPHDIARHSITTMEECSIGWGNSTKKSLQAIKNGAGWLASGNPEGAGNGVAMKIAPLSAFLAAENFHYSESRQNRIIELALTTHRTDLGVHSAFAQAYAILWLLLFAEQTKADRYWNFHNQLLDFMITGIKEADAHMQCKGYTFTKMKPEFGLILQLASLKGLRSEFQKISPAQIAAFYSGADCYVLHSLPFSLAMFLRQPHSIETLYDTVSAGGDTDTNGSMVGSLLGALNGTKIFPKKLVNGLWQKKRILKVANDFCDRFKID